MRKKKKKKKEEAVTRSMMSEEKHFSSPTLFLNGTIPPRAPNIQL